MPGLLYADDLVLCGESEEDLRSMVECFVEVCRKGLIFIAGKIKVMVLGGEEGLGCAVGVDVIRLEMSRNLNTWDVFCTNQVLLSQNVVGR